MMLQTIIQALDAAIAARLPAAVRHGLCELHRVDGGTMPVMHSGSGSFEPVATDASGSFSYWRIAGRLREDAAEIAGSCSDGFTAEIPLRFVALLDREACGAVEDAARAAASDARALLPALRQALNAAMITARSASIDAVTESVYRSEFSGAGFGMPGADKAMVAIDIALQVTGRASCFDPCDDAGDFLCRVIQSQQWQRIRGCLTQGQEAAAIADLCGEGPCPTPCEVIEDMDASEIVACVPNGDRPALLCETMNTPQATPEAIVVCLDGAGKTDAVRAIVCDPCPPCAPMEISINGTPFREVADPCGAAENIPVSNTDGDLVGSEVSGAWQIGDVTVLRDGEPYASVKAEGSIDVQSDCQPCDPFLLKFQGSTIQEITDPCGGEADLDCDTLINGAMVSGSDDDGYYAWDGSEYLGPNSTKISYTGTEWRCRDGINTYNSAPCPESTPPWDADWSGTPITVTQATIEDACCACGPGGDVEVQLKDSAGNDIGAPDTYACGTTTTKTAPDGSVQLEDSAANPIGSPVAVRSNQTGVAVVAPDATVQLKDTAGNNIGSPDSYRSNSSNNKTAPDGSVQRKDSAGADIGSPIAVRSNQTGLAVTCPDGTVRSAASSPLYTSAVLSNGTLTLDPVRITRGNGTTQDVEYRPNTTSSVFTEQNHIYMAFRSGDAISAEFTVTSDFAGTYSTLTNDGGSGTIAWQRWNGSTWAALGSSFTLATNDLIRVTRTTSTNAGWANARTN